VDADVIVPAVDVPKVPAVLESVLVLLEIDENPLELPGKELRLELAVPDGLMPELSVVDPIRLEISVDCSVPGPTAFDTLVRLTELPVVDPIRLEIPVDCSVPGPTAFDTLVRPMEVDEI
jgi:hypothetical protein